MYIVTEIQVFADGNISTPSYSYEDRNKADNKYYSLLAGAATSKLPRHSVVMVTVEGYFVMSGTYEHIQEITNEGQTTSDI